MIVLDSRALRYGSYHDLPRVELHGLESTKAHLHLEL